MAQTNTITTARKAMLELIKNNRNNRNNSNISCNINSNNSGGDNDRLKKGNQCLLDLINMSLRKNLIKNDVQRILLDFVGK